MDEYRLVKVIWKDIQGIEGPWVDFQEASEITPVTVETVGWVVVEDSKFVTLVSSLEAQKTFCGSITSIPKGCILSMTLVSVGTVDVLTEKSDSL